MGLVPTSRLPRRLKRRMPMCGLPAEDVVEPELTVRTAVMLPRRATAPAPRKVPMPRKWEVDSVEDCEARLIRRPGDRMGFTPAMVLSSNAMEERRKVRLRLDAPCCPSCIMGFTPGGVRPAPLRPMGFTPAIAMLCRRAMERV